MIGLLLWKEPGGGRRAVTLREISVMHARLLLAEVARGPKTPEAVVRRRVAAAGKRLRKQGVIQAVLPRDFSYGPALAKAGVGPVSTLPLRQALAGARVAVTAGTLTGQVARTVTELCLRHRYVLLDLPYGGEELCRQLRREYGVSLLLGPDKDQLEGAEALVLFDPRTDLTCRNPAVLRLYDETAPLPPLLLPPALEEKLPEGADRAQLLAFLREAGVLRLGQIAIGWKCQ